MIAEHPSFREPKIGEIRSKIQVQSYADLVTGIKNLNRDQYIEIPLCEEIVSPEFADGIHYKKAGPHLSVSIPDARYRCVGVRSIDDMIRDAMKQAEGDLRGYGWTGFRDSRHRLIGLADLIDGMELFTYIRDVENDENIKIQDYSQRIVAFVPSRTKEKEYNVALNSLPIATSDNPLADAIDLFGSCNCEDKVFNGELNTKYKSGEERFCAHEVAAYYETAAFKEEKQFAHIAQNPFPIARGKAIKFNRKLKNNVVKEVEYSGKMHRRALTKIEKELLNWIYLQREGADEMFKFEDAGMAAQAAMYYAEL